MPLAQWGALDGMYPGQVRLRVLEGLGHLMSAAAENTVTELDRMEAERVPLAVAA